MYNFDIELALRNVKRSEEAIKSDSMLKYASTRKTLRSNKTLKGVVRNEIITKYK